MELQTASWEEDFTSKAPPVEVNAVFGHRLIAGVFDIIGCCIFTLLWAVVFYIIFRIGASGQTTDAVTATLPVKASGNFFETLSYEVRATLGAAVAGMGAVLVAASW